MPLAEFHVAGYRSIRSLWLRVERATVLVGPNGSGKTNLYMALRLLHAAATGRLAGAVADEGGMPSVLWAGKPDKKPRRVRIAVRVDDLSFHLAFGLPIPSSSMFGSDPLVKEETIYHHQGQRKVEILTRRDRTVSARDHTGERVSYPVAVDEGESVLSELREPHRFPELAALRDELLRWRFYHHFRTDAASPLRQPQVAARTPVLAHDGRDLAAAIQTLREAGNAPAFDAALQGAFPGALLEIQGPPRFSLTLRLPGVFRPLTAQELSDGTLQYLCLLAALLSPRPPALLALNEPETSLHPDLFAPLARLIVDASARSQVWVTTHAGALAREIEWLTGVAPLPLEKVEGETQIGTQTNLERKYSM